MRAGAAWAAAGLLLACPLDTPSALAASGATLAAELRHLCPEKRLDWLNPGILVDGVEAFRGRLPAAHRARLQRLAAPALGRCVAGAGCVNAAYAEAAEQMGLAARMAQTVCAMRYHCVAPFECTSD